MKVQKPEAVAPAPSQTRFRDALNEVRQPGVSAPPKRGELLSAAPKAATPGLVSAPARTAQTAQAAQSAHAQRIAVASQQQAEVSAKARGRVEGEAERLKSVRDEHSANAHSAQQVRGEDVQAQTAFVNEKAVDAIMKELVAAFESGPSKVANEVPQAPTFAAVAAHRTPASEADFKAENTTKAEQAVALIEKIGVFVKAGQRPTMALTLNNTLGAWVEIEKVGPGAVAVKLKGNFGPPAPDAVGRIREELRARGLKVAALSVS